VTGTYDDAGTLTIDQAPLPGSFGSDCQGYGGGASLSMTFRLSPAIFDVG
jgi:hypothetical protein